MSEMGVSSGLLSTWICDEEEFFGNQVTPPVDDETIGEDAWRTNRKNRGYKHVPHKDKPAQAVARRNARERKRVQAVNLAFARLRKMVPVEHARGKRISKVKTLQYAIDYIHGLLGLLEQDRNYHRITHYYTHKLAEDFLDDFSFEDEL